jgi:hypothetical protein
MIETPDVGLSYKPSEEPTSKRPRPRVIDVDVKRVGWDAIAKELGVGIRQTQRYSKGIDGVRLRVVKQGHKVFAMQSWIDAVKSQITVTIGDE